MTELRQPDASEFRPGADLARTDLTGLDLRGTDLSGADLSGADLRFARLGHLEGAVLTNARLGNADMRNGSASEAKFRQADLTEVNLSGANLMQADFSDACLLRGKLDSADLTLARLDNANLSSATLEGSNLSYASFCGANLSMAKLRRTSMHAASFFGAKTRGADISGSDMRRARGFTFDFHRLDGIKLPAGPHDPWSTLRRRYTGFMAFAHIGLASLALAPYFVETLLDEITGVSRGELRVVLLIGGDHGLSVMVSSVVLVVYNVLRILFTWRLSMLREDESRSLCSPSRESYWRFWKAHYFFMRWIELVALAVGLVRTCAWLFGRT